MSARWAWPACARAFANGPTANGTRGTPNEAAAAAAAAAADTAAGSGGVTGVEEAFEGEQASVEDVQAQLAQQRKAVQEMSEQVEKLTDNWKRSLAEMENLRTRTAKQVETTQKFAVQGIVKSLLDVADNLQRALEAVPPEALTSEGATDPQQLQKLLKSLVEGVQITEKVLLQAFQKNGVEQYNPIDEPFDPNVHNALFQVPSTDKEPGVVCAVTKKGYKLNGRLVRPAEVGVTRAP